MTYRIIFVLQLTSLRIAQAVREVWRIIARTHLCNLNDVSVVLFRTFESLRYQYRIHPNVLHPIATSFITSNPICVPICSSLQTFGADFFTLSAVTTSSIQKHPLLKQFRWLTIPWLLSTILPPSTHHPLAFTQFYHHQSLNHSNTQRSLSIHTSFTLTIQSPHHHYLTRLAARSFPSEHSIYSENTGSQ